MLGVPCVAAGVPVELAPGDVVVVGLCIVVVLGEVPGCAVVVLGLVVGPIPGLGVTVPVFCAVATPTASANTDDANKIFRIKHAPCMNAAAGLSRAARGRDTIAANRFFCTMRLAL